MHLHNFLPAVSTFETDMTDSCVLQIMLLFDQKWNMNIYFADLNVPLQAAHTVVASESSEAKYETIIAEISRHHHKSKYFLKSYCNNNLV